MITKRFTLLTLSIVSLASFSLALLKGSTHLTRESLMAQQIFFDLRLPRACAAFVTGGLLALSGALMQVLLRNPLADPYILGVSGGAAVATLLGIITGLSGLWLTGGAFIGSFCTILVIFVLTVKNSWHTERLLLTGVALASVFSAIISFILLTSSDKTLRGMLFWMVGDLSYSHMPYAETVILFLGLIYGYYVAPALNILIRGRHEAQSLGVHVKQFNIQLYVISSLLTATAVTLSGCIGFVGLIVPHLIRFSGINDHRLLLPASVLLGGSLVTVADTFSRTLLAPQQLPVGIFMTLLGIPVFLFLLQKHRA